MAGVDAVFDLFEDGAPASFRFETSCSGSAFDLDDQARSFTFRETSASGLLPDQTHAGLGCGEAAWRVRVPTNTDHVHVRFFADRAMSTPDGGLSPFGNTANFVQDIQIRDVNGAVLAGAPYFPRGADPVEETYHEALTYPIPAGLETIDVVWVFEDLGSFTNPTGGDLDPGEQYSATVRAPQVEYSTIPVLDVGSHLRDERVGTLGIDELTVEAPIPADLLQRYGVVLRVHVDDRFGFHHATAPSGIDLGDPVTREGTASSLGHGLLVEQSDTEFVLYVSAGETGRQGPGTYTLVFREVRDIKGVPALIPVAAVLLLSPLPFAVAAIRGVRAYEREAFGAFRRSAARLRTAVFVALAYYGAVVLAAWLGQRLELMAAWPLRAEAWLLYLQALLAIVAFTLLWLVARELRKIIRPRAPEAGQ